MSLLSSTTPTSTAQAIPPTQDEISRWGRELMALHNQARADAGLGALTYDKKLGLAAIKHAKWMATVGRLSHDGEGASADMGDRVKAEGFVYSTAAENISWNQMSPTDVVAGWLRSQGHRANILNRWVTHVGFGHWYRGNGNSTEIYWCTVFGTPMG